MHTASPRGRCVASKPLFPGSKTPPGEVGQREELGKDAVSSPQATHGCNHGNKPERAFSLFLCLR